MRRLIWTGTAIWAGATLALRVAGQYVLRPSEGPAVALLFGVSFAGMWALASHLLARRESRAERALAAVALVIPGMLLDVISAAAFDHVFPNIPSGAAGLFGGWLLFCNGIVLLAAIVGRSRERAPIDAGAPAR